MLSSLQSPCNPNHWVLRCSQLWVDLGTKLIPKERRASPTSTRGWAVLHPCLCAAEAVSTEKSRQAGRVRHVLSMASCHPSLSGSGLAISRMSWASLHFPWQKEQKILPFQRLPSSSYSAVWAKLAAALSPSLPLTQPPPPLLSPSELHSENHH